MELIILTDGVYHLIEVTKEMTKNIVLVNDTIDCFDLCDILRIKLSTYMEPPFNQHVMNNGSGSLVGCMCR
tara:strand:- start:280 stop:492 length:213 start_codon:yes stop_codon:yes gene_type:complete